MGWDGMGIHSNRQHKKKEREDQKGHDDQRQATRTLVARLSEAMFST